MKWIYVKKGTKNQVIVFVACENNGKPVKPFLDMNLAIHYEESTKFSNSIIDFNNESKRMIEARWNGKEIEDKRQIIDIYEFKRVCKEHKTDMKI